MSLTVTALLAAAGFLVTLSSSIAAETSIAEPVKVSLTASKVVIAAAGGKEALQPGETAKPGDLLQYDATYRNRSEGKIGGLQATLPIPAGLGVELSSLKPAGALASIDGANFAPIPLMRSVTSEEGKVRQERVPSHEYRALRWSAAQLAAGAQFTVSARARVLTNAPITASK